MEFKDKIKTVSFGKIQTKKVTDRNTGEFAGEQRIHLDGRIDAVVMPKAQDVSTQKIPPA
jgi:hypothetical protein